ncbi:MAG: outer membrane lipoprotein carrier protein LolA [Nitrospinota bacterium]
MALLVFWALVAAPSPGRALRLEKLVDRLQAKYESTRTLVASFEQENRLKTLGTSQLSQGRVYIHKPGRVRWEYQSPEPQLLVSDGETFWVYTPRLKQVIVSPVGRAFASPTPATFLGGSGDLRKTFRFRLLESPRDGKGNYRLELIPREGSVHRTGGSIQKLTLVVGAKSFQILETAILDPMGNLTSVRFTRVEEGVELAPSLFRFQVPPDVEVVRPPRLPASPPAGR